MTAAAADTTVFAVSRTRSGRCDSRMMQELLDA